MKLYVLLTQSRDGIVEADVAMTQDEMDRDDEVWATALEAARAEVRSAPKNRLAATAMGVVTFDLSDAAVAEGLARGSVFTTGDPE